MTGEELAALFLQVAAWDHATARNRLTARDPAGAALALLDAGRALDQAAAALESGRELAA